MYDKKKTKGKNKKIKNNLKINKIINVKINSCILLRLLLFFSFGK